MGLAATIVNTSITTLGLLIYYLYVYVYNRKYMFYTFLLQSVNSVPTISLQFIFIVSNIYQS